MAKKHWIADAISKAGSLREALHVKSGHNIPESKLKKAEAKGGKMAKRAHLAETLKSFHHK